MIYKNILEAGTAFTDESDESGTDESLSYFVVELPLDHEFQLFSASAGGFYPGSPRSLHL